MTQFTERVISIIQSIPAGKVMTYGQIAALAGNPRGARQVVRVLHSMNRSHQLPWHRVINAKGEISLDEDMFSQKERLSSEGILFTPSGKINLSLYRYEPVLNWIAEEDM